MLNSQSLYQAQIRHAAYYLSQFQEISSLFQQGGENVTAAVQKARHLWGQIQQGQAWAANNLVFQDAASMCIAYTENTFDLLKAFQPLSERIHWLSDSLAAAQQLGNHEAMILFLIELGEARLFGGKDTIDVSIDHFQDALKLAREHVLYAGEARALLGLGRAEILKPDRQQARKYIGTALSMFRHLSDKQGIADCLRNLGTLEENTGHLQLAKQYQQEALDVYSAVGDEGSIAIVLSRLASIAEREADYVTGYHYAEKALAIARRMGDSRAIARSLSSLGLICDYSGQRAMAEMHFQEMLHLSRMIGDRRYLGLALINLGYIASMNGESQQALTYYIEALEIARYSRERYREAAALANIASVHLEVESLEDGYQFLREGLLLAHEIEAEDLIFNTVRDFAYLLAARGQLDFAAEVFGLALSLPASQDPQEVETITRVTAAMRQRIPADRLEAGIQRGKDLDLDATIQRLVAECL